MTSVLVVLVIGTVFLLYVRMEKGRKISREELYAARLKAAHGLLGLESVQREIDVQVTAGYADLNALAVLVDDQLTLVQESPNRKEIPRHA